MLFSVTENTAMKEETCAIFSPKRGSQSVCVCWQLILCERCAAQHVNIRKHPREQALSRYAKSQEIPVYYRIGTYTIMTYATPTHVTTLLHVITPKLSI